MKILIVTRYFTPDITPRSYRATELAKEFALQGHNVTVLTPRKAPEHADFEAEHGIIIKDLGVQAYKSIPAGNSKFTRFISRAFTRALLMALDYPSIEWMFKVRRALTRENEYDLLISIAAPHSVHWGTAWAWRNNRSLAKTWVADCGDPYMGCTNDTFTKWPHFAHLEKSFMRNADYVTIPVEGAISGYYPEFHSKIHVIPQGFKIDNSLMDQYVQNGIPHFAYAGGFSAGLRDPRPLLDFLTTIHLDFRFFVFSSNIDLIRAYKDTLGDKLVLNDIVPRDQLLKRLANMEFLINMQNRETTVQRPSKLIDYAICGRPVLNIGPYLDPDVILQFLHGNYSTAMPIDDIEQYRIENVVARFLALADSSHQTH